MFRLSMSSIHGFDLKELRPLHERLCRGRAQDVVLKFEELLYRAMEMPKEGFKRVVRRKLTGKETEAWEVL